VVLYLKKNYYHRRFKKNNSDVYYSKFSYYKETCEEYYKIPTDLDGLNPLMEV
jgi:hypothetical protein